VLYMSTLTFRARQVYIIHPHFSTFHIATLFYSAVLRVFLSCVLVVCASYIVLRLMTLRHVNLIRFHITLHFEVDSVRVGFEHLWNSG